MPKVSSTCFIALAFFLSACGSGTKPINTPTVDTSTDMQYLDKLSKETMKMSEVTEKLKSLAPSSIEKIKALFPASLNGYERTKLDGVIKEGNAFVSAVYQKAAGVEMLLYVQDCTGESGATEYALRYWNVLNITEENEDGYTRTISLNGGKAIEEYKKMGDETILTWFAAGRLLAVLKAKGLNAAILRQSAASLDFNQTVK